MDRIKVGVNEYEILEFVGKTDYMMGYSRKIRSIKLQMNIVPALSIFVNDIQWSLIEQYSINPEVLEREIDQSEYSIAGPITDNRDGTITVLMGKPTAEELLELITGEEVTE